MNKAAIEAYLKLGKRHGVPLQHTLTLICHARRDRLSELTRRCGVHRNTLYKALAGETTPSEYLIKKISQELEGLNPWQYAPGVKDETDQ